MYVSSRSPDARSTDARFASLAAVAADAIVIIDENSVIQSWNHGAEVIFGRSEAAMVGCSLLSVIPERHRAHHERGVARLCRETGVPFDGQTREMTALRADGREFPIELTVSTWLGEQGRLFIGIIRDISERKNAEAEREALIAGLKEAVDLKNRMFGLLAHDLRNPIGAMIGFAELLEMTQRERLDEKAKSHLQSIRESGAFTLALIEDVLVMAVQDADRVSLTLRALDFSRLAAKAAAANRLAASRKKVEIVLDLAPDTPVLGEADAVKIEQLLNNLIGNAIKFSHAGGKVRVAVGREGDRLAITVADQGNGISAEVQKTLFQPFGRGLRGTAGEPTTGLGLYICKRIVEAHGGVIAVDSSIGQGTRFTVSLPAV